MHELAFEVTRHVRANVPSQQLTKLPDGASAVEPADTFRKVSLTPPEESVSPRQTFIASIQGCGAATTELSLIHQQASRSSSLRLLLNHVPYQLDPRHSDFDGLACRLL